MITYPTNKLQKVLLSGGCEQRNLPSGYTQVEYLSTENARGPYIDTGIKVGSKTRVVAKYKLFILNFTSPCSVRDVNEGGAGYGFGLNNVQQFISDYNGNRKAFANITPNTTDIITVDKNRNVCTITIGGQSMTVTNTASTFETNNTLVFYGQKSNGIISTNIYNFYSFKLWTEDVLVLDLVPARRDSDNELGFYNKVNGDFLTNAGTGEFTAGPDVVPTPDTPIDIVCNNGVLKVDNQGQIYTDGAQEVVTDNLGNTANAEMLLAVGDYKDTQEVLTGSVTRNAGVVVLNGTENWYITEGNNPYFAMADNVLVSGSSIGNCTHFPVSLVHLASQIPTAICSVIHTDDQTFHIHLRCNDLFAPTSSNLPIFKAWLASEYAKGTPVIFVGKLANPTTEQVTPKPLAGSSATVTAGSIDNLPIESSTIAELKKRYIGDKEVKRVYIGENIVYNRNN